MIYILGKSSYDGAYDLDDIVVMASTKIEDVLEYVIKNVPLDCISSHSIFITPENSFLYDVIGLGESTYESFVKYTPNVFKEYESECEHVKNELFKWCNAIKSKNKKQKEEREQRQIDYERKLYEELKAKFGD